VRQEPCLDSQAQTANPDSERRRRGVRSARCYRVVFSGFGGEVCTSRPCSQTPPVWREVLELETLLDDPDRTVAVRVEQLRDGDSGGAGAVVGRTAFSYADLAMNEGSDHSALALTTPDGRSAAGTLRVSYRLLLPHEALLSIRILQVRLLAAWCLQHVSGL
jgi:hypothetical protein